MKIIAVECKASTAPTFTKGFWKALEDVKPDKVFVVAPIALSYMYTDEVEICGLNEVIQKINNI